MGSPFKMNPKTPLMKALVGKQKNLPDHLKQAILDAPESPAKSYGKSPMKKTDPKKKGKAKPFVDPGEPAEFKKGTWKGTTESVIRPYEGTAFVGTRGGKRQAAGSKVTGFSEKAGESTKLVRGTVKGSGKGSKTRSKQSSTIKGASIEQKKYKKGSAAKMKGVKALKK